MAYTCPECDSVLSVIEEYLGRTASAVDPETGQTGESDSDEVTDMGDVYVWCDCCRKRRPEFTVDFDKIVRTGTPPCR